MESRKFMFTKDEKEKAWSEFADMVKTYSDFMER